MASFGENLRRERELRGITLNELANSTKVGVRHLEALERNQFHRLPGGIFNRGFVRAIARYMKLDEDFWMSEYARAAGEEPEVLARYVKQTPPPAAGHRRSAWSFAALLVLFAVGAYVVHDLRMRRAAEAAPTQAAPAPAVARTADSSSTPTAPVPLATPPAPDPLSTAPAGETGSAQPPAPSSAPPEAAGEPTDLRLQVDVVEEAWVRVTVDDEMRYDGRVQPGQPRRFRASHRFEVSTRNASAVVLTLNGETLPPLGQPGEERTVVLTAQDLKPAPR